MLAFHASFQADLRARNEPWRKRLQLEVVWSAFLHPSDDVGDHVEVLWSLVVCLAVTTMTSKMMLSLSSMADEAVQAEVQQLGVETVANED